MLVLWRSEMATTTADVVQQLRKWITLKIAQLEADKANVHSGEHEGNER